MEKRIGRERECELLSQAVSSRRSEFIVLYGRRRVGKTFLVRSFFDDRFDFLYVGAHRVRAAVQLQNFRKALVKYSGNVRMPDLRSWSEAFDALAAYLETLPLKQRKVLFFDEMPWIDTRKSDFVAALEYFWNSWAMYRDDIVLIASGSATSWMADKLIANRGGLHQRITRQLYLRPFTLRECREYLLAHDMEWGNHQILECYMVFGGIPYYWSLLDASLSLPQNIDQLIFRREGLLHHEFDELYTALFSKAESYIAVVQALARRHDGMTRDELIQATGCSGGALTKLLRNLERCDFIGVYSQFGLHSNRCIYRLQDFYTLFHLKFVQDMHTYDPEFWAHHFLEPQVHSWEGLTFELVALTHLGQIRKALGISGMATRVSSWRYVPSKDSSSKGLPDKGAQIDLLISRADHIIHLCEAKFSSGEYLISKEFAQKMQDRMEIFRQVTHTRDALVHTLITADGLAKGGHRSLVHSEVAGEDLFA